MTLKLTKIVNVKGPGRLVGPDPRQAGTDFAVQIGALSKVNRARMSELTNVGRVTRQAMESAAKNSQ